MTKFPFLQLARLELTLRLGLDLELPQPPALTREYLVNPAFRQTPQPCTGNSAPAPANHMKRSILYYSRLPFLAPEVRWRARAQAIPLELTVVCTSQRPQPGRWCATAAGSKHCNH